jgi:parallel beta helix pectate lyase-like protein
MRRLLLFAVVTLAAVVVPVASGTGDGGATVVAPGESIQAAVDAASPGDTIVVRAGVYHEGVVITTDDLELIGKDAVLEPPAGTGPAACDAPDVSEPASGFCVLGDVDFDTGEVNKAVERVSIAGFTVRGFSDFGIVAIGAQDATFAHNVAEDNGEYGITAFASSGTRIVGNRTSGSGEAGIYVGDSPDADAVVKLNETFDNQFGIFVRNAEHGTIALNKAHGNCLGILVLGDAPGPAGEFSLTANAVRDNTRVCPAGEEAPPLSGVGIALVGAHDNSVKLNLITGNRPGGPSAFSGGVVVVTGIPEEGPTGTPSTGNRVAGNVVLGNDPDLFWDEQGDNEFAANICRTSSPDDLC